MGEEIERMDLAGADWTHLDVMDGHFVPNITFGAPVIKAVRQFSNRPFDVHLMISDPLKYVDDFIKAGADIIDFHVESDSPIDETIDKIISGDCKAGLAVKPNTPVESVFPFLDRLSMVLIMTVEPGFGGQKFMADMMPKVAQLRAMLDEVNPDCELEVDGGVDTATRDACVNAGANVLVAGSAVYKAADIPAKIKALREG